ncbi:MAG: ABC transporter permease [Butyrivibrio sp.]|nr:ABC transporter permease [Butyrivibrio sp.]
MKKSQSTTGKNKTAKLAAAAAGRVLPPVIAIAAILLFWSFLSGSELMPSYMMPSPVSVCRAFANDWSTLWSHAAATLGEAGVGLAIGIAAGFVISVLMDAWKPLYNALYPIVIVSQTVPSIAIAPLLTLWLGFGTTPKIVLIVITTFFPITVGLLDGFGAADPDAQRLLRAMGAGPVKRFIHIKLPYSLGYFFSGLKISVAYSIVGAVISEWLGGTRGLGVFMTRLRKSFAYDRMFSLIIFISAVSLLLMLAVIILKWLVMPWERRSKSASPKR